jgi:hypothetical protein
MAMDLGASAGGGIALQDVLRQLAEVAFRKQQLAQESQRIGIAQQAQADNSAYRNASLKSLEDERATSAQLRKQASGKQFAETLPMGTKLDQGGLERLTDADMAGPEFVEHKDATLGSTNLSGAVQGGAAAPKILRLMSSANPGQGPSDTFRGTAGQQFSAQSRQDALSAREQARQDREAQLAQAAKDRKDAAAQAATDREHLAKTVASLKPPPQQATVVIQTVDADGNAVRKIVPKTAGSEFAAAPTTDQRNRSAATGRAAPVLKSIADLSERINVNQGLTAKIKGTAEHAKAQANLSDDVSEYEAVVQGFTPLLARAMGHTGVLTELDVASVRKMLPSPTDSKSVRDRKINRIHEIMGGSDGPAKADPLGIR